MLLQVMQFSIIFFLYGQAQSHTICTQYQAIPSWRPSLPLCKLPRTWRDASAPRHGSGVMAAHSGGRTASLCCRYLPGAVASPRQTLGAGTLAEQSLTSMAS